MFVESAIPVLAFFVGACIGSFLNVCIHRIPRELSVNQPRRSFCPSCKNGIAWYDNLPVLSWFVLRGKCRICKEPISPRYPIVEALTGVLLFFIWSRFHWQQALPYSVFTVMAIAASGIDFDTMIIPDRFSLGTAVLGILFSGVFPFMHGETMHVRGLLASLVGAFIGFGVLYAVILLGKLAFGRHNLVFDEPEPWTIDQPDPDEEPRLSIGGEQHLWGDMFFRPKLDRLRISGGDFEIDGRGYAKGDTLEVFIDHCLVNGERIELENVDYLKGMADRVVVPREAMGEGDARFMAGVGAFFGWQAVFFTLSAACFTAIPLWLIAKLAGKEEVSRQIPFGPYLAWGAGVWMFFGPRLIDYYRMLVT